MNILDSPAQFLQDEARENSSLETFFAGLGMSNGWVLMLFAYLDRSELPEGVVAVGGFLSHVSRWIQFEKRWLEVLESEGISCFHMTDFETRQGEFKDWFDPKRRKVFIRRLIGVIGSVKPLAISTGMLVADFRALSQSQRRKVGSTPYVWCAVNSAISAMKWVKEHGRRPAPIACVFEAGDEGSGEVLDALTVAKQRNEEFNRQLHSVIFAHKNAVVPLQAADFFAYETAKQLVRTAGLDQREIRKSVKRLLQDRVTDVVGHYVDAKALKRLAGDDGNVVEAHEHI